MKYSYLLLLLLLVGCVTDSGLDKTAELKELFDYYSFPQRIASYEISSEYDYRNQDPGHGVSRSYKNPIIGAVTIYIYDGGHKEIEEGVDNEKVIKEFVATAIKLPLQGGINPERVEDSIGKPDMYSLHRMSFWKARWSKTYGDRETAEYIFIRGLKNKFLKIRITLYADTEIKVERELDLIMGEIILNLVQGPQPVGKADSTR